MATFSNVRNQLYARLQPPDPNDPNAASQIASPTNPGPIGPSSSPAPSTAAPGGAGLPPSPSAGHYATPQPVAGEPGHWTSGPSAPQPIGPQPFDYAAARDAWMSGQYGKDEAGAAKWAAQYGIPYTGGDTINLPNGGGLIDILGNFKSGVNVSNNWTPAGGNGPNPNGAGSAPGGAPGAVGGAGGGGDFQSQVRALLMQQLQGLSKPVDPNDPTIANEFNAQSRLIDRNREQRRAAMAERMAFNGLNSGGAGSGAFESEIASGFEDAGQQKSGVLASLMGRELQSKRSALLQNLQMALATGDNEMARDLQLQLASMENELRRLGLGQQASQWNDQYGLAKSDAEYTRDRDAARAKAGLPF